MNVSELSRQLKVTTAELLEKLPQLGFDIGRRAIKVDDRIALRIIEAWKSQAKRDREMSRIAEIRGVGQTSDEAAPVAQTTITVPSVITVREFASLMDLPINQVLSELMKNGVLTSMNERIDFDTAMIVGEELGFKVEESNAVGKADASQQSQDKLKQILEAKTDQMTVRPPVVVVMGHVDHGKTKILDAIRKTDVVSGESGGITQHIGAYQVRKNNRLITFIDTPGHEAFTAMRSRGARVADVAILVIAADDGVRPQTQEAIKIIQDANLPFVVAINKIDKPEANLEKVKQDLATLGLLPEDWGGPVVCVPVSAKVGTGIDELLETILLVADLDKDKLMTDAERPAIGTIVESHVDKGEGPVATILIQAGTLRVGDALSLDQMLAGKVRALKDYKGENVLVAAPGMPVKILGLKVVPAVGSIMEAPSDTSALNKDVRQFKAQSGRDFSVTGRTGEDKPGVKNLNLIIKADVLGSAEAIIESLAKLETAEVKIKIVGRGLGLISEADVLKAEATGSQIIGFHVKPAANVENLARDKKVAVKYFEVIYHLIEDVQTQLVALQVKDVSRQLVGKLEVIKVFRKEAKNMIIGGRVLEGGVCACETVIVTRGGEPVASGKISRIECAKKAVADVGSGQECGLNYEGNPIISEGDVLEFYQEAK